MKTLLHFICLSHWLASLCPLCSTHLLIHNGVACTQSIHVVVHCVVVWISGGILNLHVASVAPDEMRVSIFEYREAHRQHPLKHDTCSVQ